jgi:hypothetical protein
MMLSILIPSIPERLSQLADVINRYQIMIHDYGLNAEILSLVDNKRRSIGQKRNDLMDLAEGEYWVMSDEDDQLTETYFRFITEAINTKADVITYLQSARINNDKATVKFGLKNINQELVNGETIQRPAWHCCTWRKEAIKEARFAPTNWGEDDLFQRVANELAKTEYHIPEICHVYEHDSHKTAAFQ